ncbi:MAG: hypothetical protein O3A01_02045 [bacterium]|nr:hypothetical protein [bacterium]
MDNSDLTVAVARLSIRLSKLVEFASLLFLMIVDLSAVLISGALLYWGADYFLGGNVWEVVLVGEFTLVIVLWMANRRLRKKVVATFFK